MLSRLDLDIAHLHWINGGFISIKLLGKIKLPIVWSILDMWPLSGAEHYMSGHDELRLMKSYSKDSRNFNDRGIDISRIAWKKKTQNYGRYNVIFPGDWMLRKNARGTLFDRMRHFVIPPAINTQIYRVYNKVTIRSQLNLPLDKKIIGYFGGISSRKGWHLIEEIINSDFLSSNSILMILVGDCFPSTYSSNPNLRIFKKTSVDDELVRLYNSLDLLVAPSMQEAYGLVAQEAQSCGVPCVVSANSGLQDVILDNQTGLLSPVNSSIVLGKKILELANSSELRERMGSTSRARALDLWDSKVVATKLKGLYEEILSDE
jgi:glycosyltransferase involved in cell wall biosynthesis